LTEKADITRISDEVARRVKSRLTASGSTGPSTVGPAGGPTSNSAGSPGGNPSTFNPRGRILIPVSVSGRHIHVTREVLESLFGKGHDLKVYRQLSQPGEFASTDRVTVVGPSGRAIENVRVLGPMRKYTQVELSRGDGLRLGLELPVIRSGHVAGTPGITVVGPAGTVVLSQGAICATRHIHMTEEDARNFGLRDGQIASARFTGERGLTLENVLIRVSDRFALDFHLDTDDANSAGIDTGCFAEIIP
jgi:putative phosphotransacetylase